MTMSLPGHQPLMRDVALAILVLAGCQRSDREQEAVHPAVTVIRPRSDAAPESVDAVIDAEPDVVLPLPVLTRAMFDAAVVRQMPSTKAKCGAHGVAAATQEVEVTVEPSGKCGGVSMVTKPTRSVTICIAMDIMRWRFPVTEVGNKFVLKIVVP
jgi:hypothetical protein